MAGLKWGCIWAAAVRLRPPHFQLLLFGTFSGRHGCLVGRVIVFCPLESFGWRVWEVVMEKILVMVRGGGRILGDRS